MEVIALDDLPDGVVARLAGLPAVRAVTLGGSRARGEHRADSDVDLGLYYRGAFDPQALRDLGWGGEVSEIGGWGGGVFNGGAWLDLPDRAGGGQVRRVDVHYRDLDVVDRVLTDTAAGRFAIEPLLFHLAGIPSYLLAAELAINVVLAGTLPRPAYPEALRRTAPQAWWARADPVFGYAAGTAVRGHYAQSVGLAAQAALMTAHAVVAGHGVWVTNEKTLLARAGLTEVDTLLAEAGADRLPRVVEAVHRRCRSAVLAVLD